MKCPNCTRTIPKDADFCAFCGGPLRRCTRCERVFGAGADFCGFCGVALAARVTRAFDRTLQQQETVPGPPGQLSDEASPTFILPTAAQDADPDIFGYLYEPSLPSHRYMLCMGDNTLGAGHNNRIIIDRPAVSWNHALVICRNGKVFLQDSASTNGTFVNGEQLQRPYQLQHEDIVRFGNVDFHVWLKPAYR